MSSSDIIAQRKLKMLKAVTDMANALITHHFPSATYHHIEESDRIVGIESVGAGHKTVRILASDPDHGRQQFIHISRNLTPDVATQDATLRTDETAREDLISDLNLLFTGKKEGEVLKDNVTPRITVGTSTQNPIGGLNVIIYGTPEELYECIRINLQSQPHLRAFVPRGGFSIE